MRMISIGYYIGIKKTNEFFRGEWIKIRTMFGYLILCCYNVESMPLYSFMTDL